MTHRIGDYFTYPYGATLHSIESAEMASTLSSVQLVDDREPDAYYFRNLEGHQIYLNESQIAAVRHDQGPCLVIAGAGSGKTRVLASRVGHLISYRKINPKNIMVLTFTKKAAEEMRNRIIKLPGVTKERAFAVTAGTFHSIFLKLIRANGYSQNILTQDSRKHTALKIIMRRMELQDTYEPEQLIAILSSLKSKMIRIYDFKPNTDIDHEIKSILTHYEQWKDDHHVMDFDDILLNAYHLLLDKPNLLSQMQNRFQYVLCDEWQDTNSIQAELVRLIVEKHNNLFVVGDDDQSIYSFNGADNEIILHFDQHYPHSRVVTLDINYRSNRNILGLANAVIKNNKARRVKSLKTSNQGHIQPLFSRPKDTDDEAAAVIQEIQEKIKHSSYPYRDITILYRTISSCRALIEQLVELEIPFHLNTEYYSFYEQPIVKQLIDYLRLSFNPNDYEAIHNILPTFYIAREKGMAFIEEQELYSPHKDIINHLKEFPNLKDFHRQQIIERISLIQTLNREKPVKAIQMLRDVFEKYLDADARKTLTMHKDMILETLSELETSAGNHNSIQQFLDFIDTTNQKLVQLKNRKPNQNEVNIMSIHKSKGLEFPVVFIIGASESILPHSSALDAEGKKDMIHQMNPARKTDAAIEEERRLMYVAITRAQHELFLSSPMKYRGKNVNVSRFLMEPFTKPVEPMKVTPKVTPRTKPLEKALVWSCLNDQCHVWKRVQTNEETHEQRNCPVCSSEMMRGEKEV